MTARCDARAPFGVELKGMPRHGLFGLGYRRWLGSSPKELNFTDFYELMLGFDGDADPVLPALGVVRSSGSLLLGEDVNGWTVGFSASF